MSQVLVPDLLNLELYSPLNIEIIGQLNRIQTLQSCKSPALPSGQIPV